MFYDEAYIDSQTNGHFTHLVVIAGIATLRSLIIAVGSVTDQKITALAPKRVYAALEVDVEPRVVVDSERALGRYVSVVRVDLALETHAIQAQKRSEVDVRLRDKTLR